MFDNDYNRQIEWRQRIKKTTLVMGIDIGDDFNAVAYMHKEGNVLAKYPQIYNSRDGIDKFVRITEELKKKKHGMQDVLIGLIFCCDDERPYRRQISLIKVKTHQSDGNHEREVREASSYCF